MGCRKSWKPPFLMYYCSELHFCRFIEYHRSLAPKQLCCGSGPLNGALVSTYETYSHLLCNIMFWYSGADAQDQKAVAGHVVEATTILGDVKPFERSLSETSDDCVIIEKPVPVINLCSPDEVFPRQNRLVKRSPSEESDDCVIIDEPIPIVDLCSPQEMSTPRNKAAALDLSRRNAILQMQCIRCNTIPIWANSSLHQRLKTATSIEGNKESVSEVQIYDQSKFCPHRR